MQLSDMRATSTQPLTDAFGWQNKEAMQQHDVHELNRILFDALEQSLAGTEYGHVIQERFFGMVDTVITCTVCGESRKTQMSFLDLIIDV